MIFTETKLKGAFVIELERRQDDRGFFARSFCRLEFEAYGLKPVIAQCGIAANLKRGSVRGMHFQFPPAAETKLVRCIRGSLFDIIVDLRPESETYLDHFAVELDAQSLRALYVPERFAHGYQVLQDDTVATYELGANYAPDVEGGLLHDEPALGLVWPLPATAISSRDRSFKPLAEIRDELKRRMTLDERQPRTARAQASGMSI